MIKSLFFYMPLMFPLMFNMMIIMILMIPSKINKFHPMTLMMMLITITLLISLKMNFLYNSWMSYLLFLIMIGGLMIIYMYITSLSNNEMFYLNLNNMKFNFKKSSILIIMTLFMYINNKYYFNFQDLWNNYNMMMMYDQMNISIIYQETNNNVTYFMMWYLYYTMICVLNICYKNKIPLRQLNI